MRAFVRGDIDGFLGLGLDNVVQLIIVVGLCQGPLGFPAAMVLHRGATFSACGNLVCIGFDAEPGR